MRKETFLDLARQCTRPTIHFSVPISRQVSRFVYMRSAKPIPGKQYNPMQIFLGTAFTSRTAMKLVEKYERWLKAIVPAGQDS